MKLVFLLAALLSPFLGLTQQSPFAMDSIAESGVSPIRLDSANFAAHEVLFSSEIRLDSNSTQHPNMLMASLIFYISDTASLDSVEVVCRETASGLSVKNAAYKYFFSAGKGRLFNTARTWVMNGKYVQIEFPVEEKTIFNSVTVWVRAKDRQGRYSNVLTAKYR